MIELYAAGTSNGMRARIALEECGLAYRLNVVDLAKGENRTAQFLAMNPNGQIPVIVDSEGPGGKPVTLSQSAAIVLYAAEKSGKHLPKDPAARPAFLQALMSTCTDVTPSLGAYFGVARSKDPHPPTLELLKSRFRAYLKVWDDTLGRQKYCVGNELTMADFSLYAGYLRARNFEASLAGGFPNLERWAAEIGARPAVTRAVTF